MPWEAYAPVNLAKVTATPSDAVKSSLWYRTDLDVIHVSDGNAGMPLKVGPSGVPAVIRSTYWHTIPAVGPVTSANFPDGRLFALPLLPPRATTLTGVACNVTLALVGGNVRFGLYASDGEVPTTLVADYGTVGVGLTGVRFISALSTPLRPVLYFAVIARQGGVLNLGMTSRDTGDENVSESFPTFTGGLNAYYRDGVSGALPASFGATAGTINSPAVALQLT